MPDFEENNVHSIEFEAPLSADGAAEKHFSIDLSLELERQLDMEIFPPTPTHSQPLGGAKVANRESLDPHVLAHIVKQLQQSLAEVTKDRDELRQLIASAHSNQAELQDALQHMIDKATTMEVELSDARKKIKDDEDAISLLRSKVEESRRALMRLQTESRRQSHIPPTLDLSRGTLSLGSPPSAKRASFAPLTGNPAARPHGHRRISSVSDSGLLASSPPSQMHSFPDSAPFHPPATSNRYSGLFGRTSPIPPQGDPDQHSAELEALRKELRAVKEELETTKHELLESAEAKEASETCVKALREFIGENNVGVTEGTGSTSVKLPPPPMLTKGDEENDSKKAAASSWGFRLWKDTASRPSPTIPQSATVASPVVVASPQIPASATPLSRKIGGFFGSRNSVSSVASSASSTTPATAIPQLQTNAAMNGREETYSVSDTSSVVEPISPPDEMETNIMVRDVTSLSDGGSTRLSVTDKEMQVEVPHAGAVVAS